MLYTTSGVNSFHARIVRREVHAVLQFDLILLIQFEGTKIVHSYAYFVIIRQKE